MTTSLPPDGVFVHPCGLCDSQEIGHGTRIWAFAHVLAGARIGRDCNICDGAFVENGASIGDRVTVKNQVMIFEGVQVGDDVFLGPGVIYSLMTCARVRISSATARSSFRPSCSRGRLWAPGLWWSAA